MTENQITEAIIGSAMEIHKTLGPGLLESVYEHTLAYELKEKGFDVHQQKAVPVNYKELNFDVAFRLDLLVNNKVIVEIKSVETVAPVHYAQTLTYLKLTSLKVGLLINFNEKTLKSGIKRLVNNY